VRHPPIYKQELIAFGGALGGAAIGLGIEAIQAARAGLEAGEVFNAGRGLLGGEAVLSDHVAQRAAQYGLSKAELADALSQVPKQEAGRGSVIRFIGKVAEVRVNRVTGTIVTVIRLTRAGL